MAGELNGAIALLKESLRSLDVGFQFGFDEGIEF
jgi:hypothetical protein